MTKGSWHEDVPHPARTRVSPPYAKDLAASTGLAPEDVDEEEHLHEETVDRPYVETCPSWKDA
jgi:hypothetical protein